jgi:hypothetical protein
VPSRPWPGRAENWVSLRLRTTSSSVGSNAPPPPLLDAERERPRRWLRLRRRSPLRDRRGRRRSRPLLRLRQLLSLRPPHANVSSTWCLAAGMEARGAALTDLLRDRLRLRLCRLRPASA